MARNRVIYQSDALYVSKNITGQVSGAHAQLDRVQSANYSFTVNRQDINQFGELGRIGYVALEPPTVNLDFTYYLTDGCNERALNFYVQTGAAVPKTFISGHMISDFSGQNFYILTSTEGNDVNNTSGDFGTGVYIKNAIGIGNAYITNYSLDASVGNLPTVSVSFEAANMNAVTGVSFITGTAGVGYSGLQLASVNPEFGTAYSGSGVVVSTGRSSLGTGNLIALRPGDITLNLSNFDDNGSGVFSKLAGTDGIHIQSAALAIPLSRTPIQRLGSRFAFARPLDLPATATLSVSAIINEITAENLAAVLDLTYEKDITLTINSPGSAVPAVIYSLRKCRLDSESFSSSIGGNKTVDLVFSTQYASLNETGRGIFMSGIGSAPIFA